MSKALSVGLRGRVVVAAVAGQRQCAAASHSDPADSRLAVVRSDTGRGFWPGGRHGPERSWTWTPGTQLTKL